MSPFPAFTTALLQKSQSFFFSRVEFRCQGCQKQLGLSGPCRDNSPASSGCHPPPAVPSRVANEPHSTQESSHLPIFTSERRAPRWEQLWGLASSGSFPLFGRGDAAVQFLAVGVEGPLVGVTAGVGTVPVTKTLGLPVPCVGGDTVGLERKSGMCRRAENQELCPCWSQRGADALGASGVRSI